MEKHVVAALVKNQFGVLARVSGMFRRRGFNIDTLTVSETEDPKHSRITVSFTGDYKIKNQLIKQLQKMPDVEKILELFSDSAVIRELVLIKINNNPEIRQDIMTVVDVFRAKISDYASDVLTIEITGESSKIDAFVELVREFGIIEICRTGIVALERGKSNILDNKNENK